MASWSALTDPSRRRRLIVWLSVGIFAFGAFYVGANMVTSTRWFCNDVCHVVHLDNARAYFDSPHSEISCIACHYPVNQDPLSFAFDRVDKLLDISPTVLGTFHMPMNHYSHLALSTPDEQCVQCHNVSKRDITPSRGVLIDHEVHTENEITCAACHNRVAHREDDIEIELPNNAKKADFMTMTACFRCHTLTQESPSGYEAPGACPACHTPDFDLVPPSHDAGGWFTLRGESGGHARAAKEEASRTADAQEVWAEEAPEFHGREARLFARLAGVSHEVLVDVPPPATVNECFTCHAREEFCDACHGVEVPHPDGFVGEHGEKFAAAQDAGSCAICHNGTGAAANDQYTCTLCHHPSYEPRSGPWRTRHDDTVRSEGAGDCFGCHLETYCSSCHIRGEPSTPY